MGHGATHARFGRRVAVARPTTRGEFTRRVLLNVCRQWLEGSANVSLVKSLAPQFLGNGAGRKAALRMSRARDGGGQSGIVKQPNFEVALDDLVRDLRARPLWQ